VFRRLTLHLLKHNLRCVRTRGLAFPDEDMKAFTLSKASEAKDKKHIPGSVDTPLAFAMLAPVEPLDEKLLQHVKTYLEQCRKHAAAQTALPWVGEQAQNLELTMYVLLNARLKAHLRNLLPCFKVRVRSSQGGDKGR
jgi:hypothetical protein